MEFGREVLAGVTEVLKPLVWLDLEKAGGAAGWGQNQWSNDIERVSRRINEGQWEGAAREKLVDKGGRLHWVKKSIGGGMLKQQM